VYFPSNVCMVLEMHGTTMFRFQNIDIPVSIANRELVKGVNECNLVRNNWQSEHC